MKALLKVLGWSFALVLAVFASIGMAATVGWLTKEVASESVPAVATKRLDEVRRYGEVHSFPKLTEAVLCPFRFRAYRQCEKLGMEAT